MYIKLKVDNSIKSVPVYFIIWILPSWEKQVLDFIIDTEPENSSKYLEVLNNIKNRWVKHVLFSVFDWLPGLAKACKLAFPNTILQRCIVHKLRYSMKFIQASDEKEFLKNLKSVYNAPNIQEATRLLEIFRVKWDKYKVVLDDWLYSMDEWWNYFKYSYPIRKLIYTTNIIEAFNSLIRRHMWKKRVFFTKKSATIAVYLAVIYNQDRLKSIYWIKQIRLELSNFFHQYTKYLI